MKRHIFRHFLALFLAFLIGSDCLLIKSFAYAAESTQSLFVDAETERLAKQTAGHGYSAIESGEADVSPMLAYAVENEFANLVKIKDGKKRTDWILDKVQARNGLSDGDALYRVAISDGKLTLKEATEVGVANSVNLKALKKKVEVARSKLTEARRGLFPTVQAVIEANTGVIKSDTDDPKGYKGESRKLNITQPIFYGGELVFTVRQAEAGLKTAQAEYKKARGEFIKDLRTAYYGVVKAEYNIQYQKTLVGETGDVYKKIKKAREQNVISDVDFLNVESQHNQAFFQSESARNDLLTAQLVFYHALGVESNESPELDLRLDFAKIQPNLQEVLDYALKQFQPSGALKFLRQRNCRAWKCGDRLGNWAKHSATKKRF
jgi:hypothetical protein